MTFTPKSWSRLAIFALIAAGISAQLAWLHMVSVWTLGEICGRGPTLHCPWCGAAVGFAALAAISARHRMRDRTAARIRID